MITWLVTLSEVVVIYNNYVSKIAQEPTTKQILPLVAERKLKRQRLSIHFEPKEEDVINAILPKVFRRYYLWISNHS